MKRDLIYSNGIVFAIDNHLIRGNVIKGEDVVFVNSFDLANLFLYSGDSYSDVFKKLGASDNVIDACFDNASKVIHKIIYAEYLIKNKLGYDTSGLNEYVD